MSGPQATLTRDTELVHVNGTSGSHGGGGHSDRSRGVHTIRKRDQRGRQWMRKKPGAQWCVRGAAAILCSREQIERGARRRCSANAAAVQRLQINQRRQRRRRKWGTKHGLVVIPAPGARRALVRAQPRRARMTATAGTRQVQV